MAVLTDSAGELRVVRAAPERGGARAVDALVDEVGCWAAWRVVVGRGAHAARRRPAVWYCSLCAWRLPTCGSSGSVTPAAAPGARLPRLVGLLVSLEADGEFSAADTGGAGATLRCPCRSSSSGLVSAAAVPHLA